MTCQEFERRLQEVLDHHRSPDTDDQLRQHAEGCERCAEITISWERIALGIDLQELPELPSGFSRQVVANYLQSEKVTRQSRSGPAVSIQLMVAIVAVILFALIPLGRNLMPSNETEIVIPSISERLPAEPAPNSIPDTQTDTETPNVFALPTLAINQAEFEQFAQPFRPVASSFNVAIEALRKTIPVGKSADKPQKPHTGAGISNNKHLVS